MQISDKHFTDFKRVFKEEFGEEEFNKRTEQELFEEATKLVSLMEVVYQYQNSPDNQPKINKAYDILFNETLKNRPIEPIVSLKAGEFRSLREYYDIQYPKDLEIFKQACVYPNYCNDKENNTRNVGDLQLLQDNNHYLLKKKHFIYFMAIHTAFLMTVFHYFGEKFEEFKLVNKGVIFEFGCTDIGVSHYL